MFQTVGKDSHVLLLLTFFLPEMSDDYGLLWRTAILTC